MAAVAQNPRVRSLGSGRTDAGVHALGQVARLELPLQIAPDALTRALNANLPHDIRVLSCEESSENFHPTYQAQSKYYSYFFQLAPYPDPLVGETIAHFAYSFDVASAGAACAAFVGKHDFLNFHTEGTDTSTTVREIYACSLHEHGASSGPLLGNGPYFEIRVHGQGFLKQMVRMMVGAVWNVARGKIPVSLIRETLVPDPRPRVAAVAPPEGLYLMQVVYPPN